MKCMESPLKALWWYRSACAECPELQLEQSSHCLPGCASALSHPQAWACLRVRLRQLLGDQACWGCSQLSCQPAWRGRSAGTSRAALSHQRDASHSPARRVQAALHSGAGACSAVYAVAQQTGQCLCDWQMQGLGAPFLNRCSFVCRQGWCSRESRPFHGARRRRGTCVAAAPESETFDIVSKARQKVGLEPSPGRGPASFQDLLSCLCLQAFVIYSS